MSSNTKTHTALFSYLDVCHSLILNSGKKQSIKQCSKCGRWVLESSLVEGACDDCEVPLFI